MFESLLQDVRYAVRSLMRRPLVSAVAVASLALGIGVNSAIFTVFDRLLLRRLPVPAAGEIVNVLSPGPKPGNSSSGDSGDHEAIFSYPLYRDLERVQTVFSGIAAQRDFSANLAYRGQTLGGEGVLVSGSYFPTLGVTPALGRVFTPDDDRVIGAHDLVVLSYSYWSTRFGASPTVIGETLTVNGVPMTIVGVAPEGFNGTATMERPQVFVPLAMAGQMRFGSKGIEQQRNNHWLYVFARLQPGVTREQAENRVNVPFAALIRDVEYPLQRSGLGSERTRERFRARRIVLENGARGQYSASGRSDVRAILLMLFAVTGFVLVIACANVANLLLARASDRSAEVAVRLSIGASRLRLVRLLLTEACLLSVLGGAAALLVSKATLDFVLSIMPAEDTSLLDFQTSTSVLVFTGALGIATGLLLGLVPALQSVRATGPNAQSRRVAGSPAASRFRTSLATAQIALATALLAQAGMFVVSLVNIARVDLGIRREGLVTFRVAPFLNGYSPEQARAFFGNLEERLSGVPGVVSVTASTHPLLGDSNSLNNVTVEGFDAAPDTDTTASFAVVGTDYFKTIGIPLLAGREFTRNDEGSTATVAIVNEAFARKFNLGNNVVGTRMARGAGENKKLDIEIVGLVRDAKYSDVKDPAPPQFFTPYRQAELGSLSFYVRTTFDSRQLLRMIPAQVNGVDPNLPVESLRTMDDQIWDNTTQDRILATLSSSFAGLATVLAAIGLYAVLAYTVSQRVREIGIRMALGARAVDVGTMILAHVGRITVLGGAIGVAAALGLARLAQSLLFGLESAPLPVMAGAVAAIVTVALCAAVFPARRASRVDPVVALRAE